VSGVDIPDEYTITLKDFDFFDVRLSGTSQPVRAQLTGDTNSPIATLITGDPGKPLATLVTGDPNKPVTTLLKGDAKNPIATTFELLNIPRLSLADIKDLLTPKIRVRMPNYEQVCLKLFGLEVFSVCLSGEFQTIIQGYEPTPRERCESDCPDLDKRPFPRDTQTHERAVP